MREEAGVSSSNARTAIELRSRVSYSSSGGEVRMSSQAWGPRVPSAQVTFRVHCSSRGRASSKVRMGGIVHELEDTMFTQQSLGYWFECVDVNKWQAIRQFSRTTSLHCIEKPAKRAR